MTDRWARLERIYHDAVALPGAERPGFLERECADDSALREEVEAMLRHADTQYLDVPADPALSAAPAAVSLTGHRLRVYQIGDVIGAGGMGEVYRARDTTLGRDVAIKVLPSEWLSDPGRRARFEREARVLASLNHPNIANIHELDTSTEVPALVMELVEGETLRDRIRQGPIPIRELLPLARQMADALEAAHDAGVVHRDFKPENVKITPTGTIKVLDFGIATILRDRGDAPTVAEHRTKEGTVLGTAPYMSPEQARGKTVDRRTDIWAFGCVLYEMTIGRRAFAGDTWSETLAAILERDPDWQAFPGSTPAALVGLIRRCLDKDPRQRLRDMGDARLELESLPAQAAPAPRPRSGRIAIALATTAVVFTAVGATISSWLRTPAARTAPPPTAFTLELTSGETIRGHPAISPDGRLIVYQSTREGVERLYLRALDNTDARPLPGTERATGAFFSPNGEHVAFFADGKLKRTSITGGQPYDVCSAEAPRGGSWGDDDAIVFGSISKGLFRVPASGGAPQVFTTADTGQGESHRYPHVLPGAKGVLFTVLRGGSTVRIAAQRAGADHFETVVSDGENAQYVGGRLIYGSANGEIFAARFDPIGLKLTGPPVAQRERPGPGSNVGDVALSAAPNGTLVYVPLQTVPRRLAIVDRQGSSHAVQQAPIRAYETPNLSPDGLQVAVTINDGLIQQDVWVYDLRGNTLRRVTNDGNSRYPSWTPDGSNLMFGRRSVGGENAFLKSADAGTESTATQLTHAPIFIGAGGWIGNDLVFAQFSPNTGSDIWIVTRGRPDTARPLIVREGTQYVRPSPDGRWLAIVSDETGSFEVYLTTPATPGRLTRISSGGGVEPVWAKSSDELFFQTNGEIFGVRVSASGAPGPPRSTGVKGVPPGGPGLGQYDVFPDGSFLILQDEHPAVAPKPVVVLNWATAIKN